MSALPIATRWRSAGALGQSEFVEHLIGALSRPAPGAWTEFVDDEQVLARGQKRNEMGAARVEGR
jgi:hypothetical protein